MSDNQNDFTVPQDPEVRKRIRQAVAEAAAVLAKIDLFKGSLKDIVTSAKDELEVPKKTFNKMVKAYHKNSYSTLKQDSEVFELFYETIMEDPQ